MSIFNSREDGKDPGQMTLSILYTSAMVPSTKQDITAAIKHCYIGQSVPFYFIFVFSYDVMKLA